jgi:hypothetical protein
LEVQLPEDDFVASRSYGTQSTIACDIMANSQLEFQNPAGSVDIQKLLLKRVKARREREILGRSADDLDCRKDLPDAHLDGRALMPGAIEVEDLVGPESMIKTPLLEEA